MIDGRDNGEHKRTPSVWMSQAETCRFFGVSPEFLLSLEGEGYLSPVRAGGRVVRYWPEDVLKALERRGNDHSFRQREEAPMEVR